MHGTRKTPPADLPDVYAQFGLAVTTPKGRSRWGETMVCCEHDGLPYCMDAHGEIDKIGHGVRHRALTIERHHPMVKAVYEHCVNAGIGDVWVLCGGGSQLQAFFGNAKGYLGILYLDLEDLKEHQQVSENGYLEAVGNKTFTLQVNGEDNDVVFDGFAVAGVELRTHAATYGVDPERDEDERIYQEMFGDKDEDESPRP